MTRHPAWEKWPKAEKVIVRQAFKNAYQRECAALIETLKKELAAVEKPEDLWIFADKIADCRDEIHRKYDFRYSVLQRVLANLLVDGSLSLDDLQGLNEEKLTDLSKSARDYREIRKMYERDDG
ncbi:MAG: hypothetical protein HZA50_06080 [Planctomycetes bacterium]|nr:hypothetical protein [Planctomycetota bacterium]